MPLVIRYSGRENNIQERFLKFIHFDQGVTGKALTDRILDCLVNEFDLDIQNCCGHFSILADEVSVCSNKEQLPLVIRYAHRDNNIQERLLKFIHCDQGVTGKALTDRILDCLVNEFDLDIQNCCVHFSILADEVSVCSNKESCLL